MGERRQAYRPVLWMLCWLVVLAGCYSVHQVKVTYRVPEAANMLEGVLAYVDFKDERKDEEVLGPGAWKEYKYYPGTLSLHLDRGEGTSLDKGLYNVPELFKEVFGTRLRALGAEVVNRRSEADVVLLVALREFKLDLVDRKWKAEMSYEARMMSGEGVSAAQTVSGQAERVKIIGVGQADQVMGDLFTDVVNRLEIREMLRRSDLLDA
ncbi:MAG: hypothetical protein ACLFUP_00890 [Desulfobacteraceae bacterium]